MQPIFVVCLGADAHTPSYPRKLWVWCSHDLTNVSVVQDGQCIGMMLLPLQPPLLHSSPLFSTPRIRCKVSISVPCPCTVTFTGVTPGCRQYLQILPERDNWSGTSSVSSLTVNGALVSTSYFPCVPQLPNAVCVHVRSCLLRTARLHGLNRGVTFLEVNPQLTPFARLRNNAGL